MDTTRVMGTAARTGRVFDAGLWRPAVASDLQSYTVASPSGAR
jgi:hypothetical protein